MADLIPCGQRSYVFFPIYDNGASLGFRFDDDQLIKMTLDRHEMNRYTNNAKVKAGLFEKKSVKAKDLILYIQERYPNEFNNSTDKLMKFDTGRYTKFTQSLDFLSHAQRIWLQHIIPFRRQKILDWIGGRA